MRLLILLTIGLGLAGCKSQCRLLSEQLCNCELNSNERSNCVSRAASAEGANPPAPADEEFCRAQLLSNACDCHLIETAEGKIRCGLARDPNAAATSDAGT